MCEMSTKKERRAKCDKKFATVAQMVFATNEARRTVKKRDGTAYGKRAVIWNITRDDRYAVEAAFLLSTCAYKVKGIQITQIAAHQDLLPNMSLQEMVEAGGADWICPELNGCDWNGVLTVTWSTE